MGGKHHYDNVSNPQRRDWTFTINAKKEVALRRLEEYINRVDDTAQLDTFIKNVEYMVIQLEKGEKHEVVHLQGYIRMKGYKRRGRVQAILIEMMGVGPHSHAMNCNVYNVEGAIRYVQKESTRIDGPWEFGTRPKLKRKKSEYLKSTDSITRMLQDGLSPKEMAKANLKAYWMYAQKVEYAYAKLKSYNYWERNSTLEKFDENEITLSCEEEE